MLRAADSAALHAGTERGDGTDGISGEFLRHLHGRRSSCKCGDMTSPERRHGHTSKPVHWSRSGLGQGVD